MGIDVTNLKLTSSRILSLLSQNCYTSIAGAVTPRMLSKQKTPHTIHVKTTFFSKCHQNSVYVGLRLLQVYGDVNRTAREEVFHWKTSSLHFAPESWPFHVKEFLPTVFQHSIGSTRHQFFLPIGSLSQVNKHHFSLRNRGSEKERVAEEMTISEVRKCCSLHSIDFLIVQLHHCEVGTC